MKTFEDELKEKELILQEFLQKCCNEFMKMSVFCQDYKASDYEKMLFSFLPDAYLRLPDYCEKTWRHVWFIPKLLKDDIEKNCKVDLTVPMKMLEEHVDDIKEEVMKFWYGKDISWEAMQLHIAIAGI